MRPIPHTRALLTLTCFATLLVLLLSWAAAALAVDAGNPLWTRVYGAADNQVFRQVASCPGGDVVVAGTTGPSSVATRLLVARYSPNGARRWVKTVEPPGGAYDAPAGVLVDAAGNTVVLATRALQPSGTQYLVCKYGATGRRLWTRVLDGGAGGSNKPYDLALDADGNVYVTGSWTTAGPTQGSCTARLRARNGRVVWKRVLSGARTLATGRSITVAGAAVYVTGHGDRGDARNEVVTLRLRSANGSVVWTAEAPVAGDYRAAGEQVVVSGSRVYVACEIGELGPVNTVGVIRYTTSGAEVWRDEIDVPSYAMDGIGSAAADRYGNLFVAGTSQPTGPDDGAFVVRWTPSKARWLWYKPSADPAWSSVSGVVPDQTGGCWLAGTYTIAPHTEYDTSAVYTARISRSGATRWERLQAGVGIDQYGYGLCLCSKGLAIPGFVNPGSAASGQDALLTVVHR